MAFNVNLEDVAIRLLLTALSQVTNNQLTIPDQLIEKVSVQERHGNPESISYSLTPELYTSVVQNPHSTIRAWTSSKVYFWKAFRKIKLSTSIPLKIPPKAHGTVLTTKVAASYASLSRLF